MTNTPDYAGRSKAFLAAQFDSMIHEVAEQLTPRQEAVAQADAHLNNVAMPTYTELLDSLRTLLFAMETPRSVKASEPWCHARRVVSKAEGYSV